MVPFTYFSTTRFELDPVDVVCITVTVSTSVCQSNGFPEQTLITSIEKASSEKKKRQLLARNILGPKRGRWSS